MNAQQIKTFKDIRGKLVKIAQDELQLTEKMQSSPQEAGPQEVVDAVAEIAKEVEAVIEMIPAEPEMMKEDITEEVVEDSPMEQAMDNKGEDYEEKMKLSEKVAELEKIIDEQSKEKVASEIADHYGQSEAKFAEIMKSDKPSTYWAAQLDTIKDFASKMNKSQRQAQNISSYVKVAQQTETRRKMI